jgi:hypothetical protein
MVYIDPEIAGDIRWRNTKLDDVTFARYAGAPRDLIQAINPLYTDLRRGLVGYQKRWGTLPQSSVLGEHLGMAQPTHCVWLQSNWFAKREPRYGQRSKREPAASEPRKERRHKACR